MNAALTTLLARSVAARAQWMAPSHDQAIRLFNGFLEGWPALAIDVYSRTAVLHDHAPDRTEGDAISATAVDFLRAQFPWLSAIVRKVRDAPDTLARNGTLVFGGAPDTQVREAGIAYAIELTASRDASLYLDTRNVRTWARENLRGQRVLNTFAHTCSLGVAAKAGGATHVLNTDRSRRFLEVGKASCALNRFAVRPGEFHAGDFWRHVAALNRSGERFDCVFLDPPFYSAASTGTVDLAHTAGRLINKLRPLVRDGGRIVAINNALFVSGAAYLGELEALCTGGHLAIERTIAVPEDFTGPHETQVGTPVTDPAPFNHSTKIAVLRVKHKT